MTSIAMFYDLESPQRLRARGGGGPGRRRDLALRAELHAVDAPHELLRHRSATSTWSTTRSAGEVACSRTCGLRIVDVQMNAVNGGSFAVTAAQRGARRCEQRARDRLAARPGGAHGPAHARAPSGSSRSGCSSIARTCSAWCGALERRRQADPRLRRLHQGERAAPVLRLHGAGHPGDRRGEPRQVRLLHARAAGIPIVSEEEARADEARLLPGPALALQGRDPGARGGVPRRGRTR